MKRLRPIRRLFLLVLIGIPTCIAAFYGYVSLNANFGTLVAGQAYRSAQMSPAQMAEVVKGYQIKTVLNLRGHHPEEAWYRDEVGSVLANGASQIDVALSSSEWMSRHQAKTLAHILETAERPILIHCFHGSERTGMVSAFLRLLEPGSTLEDGLDQFTVRHLFVPVGDGVRMPEHLLQYKHWLGQRGLSHAPSHFREWITKGYAPGTPSREDWPYDPYPLQVVTRASRADNSNPEVEKTWAPGSEPGSASRDPSRPRREVRVR